MKDTLTRGILLVVSFVIVWGAMRIFKINIPGWLFVVASLIIWLVLTLCVILSPAFFR